MDRMRTPRNLAIVALLAAAVWFLPGGGQAADSFAAALWIVLAAGFAYFASRVYRERRLSIYSLGQQRRALLYGGAALGFFAAAAQHRMWETGLGEFAWFVIVGVAVYALLVVYRFSRSY